MLLTHGGIPKSFMASGTFGQCQCLGVLATWETVVAKWVPFGNDNGTCCVWNVAGFSLRRLHLDV